jgi:hypothetical protein
MRMSRSRRPRNKRTAATTPLHEPSAWRLQHGDFTPPVREADPETGLTVIHRRAIDTLGQMLSNGTITADMHDAGQVFRSAFRAAALDPLRARSLVWVPATTGETLTERVAAARERVARALDALGGPASPAGSAVWHVVGCEQSIREWATLRGMHHVAAGGVLVAALGVLAKHYGLAPRERPQTPAAPA